MLSCINSNIPCIDWIHAPGFANASVRYREVPDGICETRPGVKSFTGYVDISETHHMFFWLFEARDQDPTQAPLTAWISGGPGASSMSELFTEHGPCRIDPDGKTVHDNTFSWSEYSNVVYIDQPVQVGFSYTELIHAFFDEDAEEIVPLRKGEKCPKRAGRCGQFSKPDTSTTANSTVAAAPAFWLTLQAVMATFPQYSDHGFHSGSESYGGHYVPIFSKYILDQNALDIAGARRIDLQSIIIGNGWFSPQLQVASFYDFAFGGGETYDLEVASRRLKQKVHQALHGKGQGLEKLKACETTGSDEVCRAADHFYGEEIEDPWLDETGRDNNDIRELDPSPFPSEHYVHYLQRPQVREAIGAYQAYIEENPTVGEAFDSTGDDARELGILAILRDLAEKGVRVTLYAGDADYECNWLGVEAVAHAVGVPGYESAGYVDVSTSDGVIHGQVKQSGVFSFVRVYEAGHAVGAFQPQLLQTIFARTLAGTDIATGNRRVAAQYQIVGPKKSTYREGNGTMQYRQWPKRATYNYHTNKPTLDNFQPGM